MLGHQNKLYDKNFINSFKNSLNEVLQKDLKEYTVGPTTKMEPGRGVGQISDLELARRMRETKRTSIFGASKQTDEYLELEKEQARRTAAKTAPAPAPAAPAAKPVAPAKTELPIRGLKGQGPGPTPDADIPTTTTSKTSSINVSEPLKVPAAVRLEPSDIRPKGPPTAVKPAAATPPLKMDTAGATDAAKAEFERVSSTPAAIRRAVNFKDPLGLGIPKRQVDPGSVQTPRQESGVSVRQVSAGARTPEAEEAFRQASMTPAAMRLRAKSAEQLSREALQRKAGGRSVPNYGTGF